MSPLFSGDCWSKMCRRFGAVVLLPFPHSAMHRVGTRFETTTSSITVAPNPQNDALCIIISMSSCPHRFLWQRCWQGPVWNLQVTTTISLTAQCTEWVLWLWFPYIGGLLILLNVHLFWIFTLFGDIFAVSRYLLCAESQCLVSFGVNIWDGFGYISQTLNGMFWDWNVHDHVSDLCQYVGHFVECWVWQTFRHLNDWNGAPNSCQG